MSTTGSIKAVLLDMDGTLVNAFGPIIYALNRTLQEFGLETMTEEAVIRHTGRGECSMISLFGEHKEAAARRFLEFHDERLFDIEPIDGAADMLDWLNEQHLGTGIVTSKSQQRAEKQLAHLGWSQKIQAVIGLCDDRRQKPDPHTMLLACEALTIEPAQAVMIGDGTADMKAAVRAGIPAIGISNSFSDEELEVSGACICFKTINMVHKWLKKQTG
ncbi:MAG: HAD family hydrolase [Mariprofundaceae bacterium]